MKITQLLVPLLVGNLFIAIAEYVTVIHANSSLHLAPSSYPNNNTQNTDIIKRNQTKTRSNTQNASKLS